RFVVPPHQLSVALSIVADGQYSRRVRIDYFNHLLEVERYDDAAFVLKSIRRGLLKEGQFRPAIRLLHAKGYLWPALELVFKLRAQEEFADLIREGAGNIVKWLAGDSAKSLLKEACGWMWLHLSAETQRLLLRRVMEVRISLITIESWFRP